MKIPAPLLKTMRREPHAYTSLRAQLLDFLKDESGGSTAWAGARMALFCFVASFIYAMLNGEQMNNAAEEIRYYFQYGGSACPGACGMG